MKAQNKSLNERLDSARSARDDALKKVSQLETELASLLDADENAAKCVKLKKRLKASRKQCQRERQTLENVQAELGAANATNAQLEKQNAVLETRHTEQMLASQTAQKDAREKWNAERERIMTALADANEIATALTERNRRLETERNDAIDYSKCLEDQVQGEDSADGESLREIELRETCDDLREQLNIYMAAGTQLLAERAALQSQLAAVTDELTDRKASALREQDDSPMRTTHENATTANQEDAG